MPDHEPNRSIASVARRSSALPHGLLLAVALVVGLPSAYLAWTNLDVRYTATGNLWIESTSASDASAFLVQRGERAPASNAWVELLRSFQVLEPVVVEHKLVLDAPRGSTVEFSVSSVRDAAHELSNELLAVMSGDGNFLHLELAGTDPQKVTDVLNSLMDRYVAVAADLKRRRFSETVAILELQLEMATERLEQSERDLYELRSRQGTAGSEDLGSGSTEEARLARDLEGAELLYNEVRARVEAARLADMSAIPDVRILDRATVPERPRDARVPVVAAILFGLVGLPLAGAALLRGRAAVRRYMPAAAVQGPGGDLVSALAITGGVAFAVLATWALLAL